MLTEGWYVGADRTPLEAFGRFLEDRSGWDDTPPLRGANALLLGRHGESYRKKKYGPGRKTFVMGIHGIMDDFSVPATGTERRALYERNLDGLLRVISPKAGLIRVMRVYPDGARREAMCEVVNEITPAVTGDTYGLVSWELLVPGSFWLDEDSLSYQVVYDITGPAEQTLEVYSLAGQTAPASDATVSVTGPCASVMVRDALSGSGFGYGALSSGQELVVDSAAFTATKNGVDVLTSLDLFGGELVEIEAAPSEDIGPSVVVTAVDAADGFSVVVEARRAWLR